MLVVQRPEEREMLELEEQERRKIDTAMTTLAREFEGRFEEAAIADIGEHELARLLDEARIPDFVPVLFYRYTRDRLLESETRVSVAA